MSEHNASKSKLSPQKSSSVFLDLIFSIVIPSFLLTRGPGYFPSFSALEILLFALAFPIIYGLYDLLSNKHFNVISLAGFLNVLLTGGIGLVQASKPIIIIKEAGFPLIIAILLFVFRDRLVAFIKEQSKEVLNLKKILLHTTQRFMNEWYKIIAKRMVYPFLLSAFLNGVITYIIIQSVPGTQAFNEELAQLLIWGFIGIALPCLVFMLIILYLSVRSLQKKTGLGFEEMFKS